MTQWVFRPEASPKLEDVLKLDLFSLSSEQSARLKKGEWIALDAINIIGYNCEKCCTSYNKPPKIEEHIFNEPKHDGEVYGMVKYICEHCEHQLGQAKITQKEFYTRTAKVIANAGGIPQSS